MAPKRNAVRTKKKTAPSEEPAVKRAKKSTTPDKPTPPAEPTPHAEPAPRKETVTTAAGGRKVMLSLTITPFTKKKDIEYADEERLKAVHAYLRHSYPAFEVRRADGQVTLFVMSCERGDENNNPHVQGFYEVECVMAENDALVRGEKAWIKVLWAEATDLPAPRVEIRVVREQDRMYLIGYCYKDEGMAHFYAVYGGFPKDDDLLARACEFYRCNAGKISFSSKKMKKNPKAEEKQLAFKLGNKVTLAVWFVHQHKLDELHGQLTLPLIIAYAIETTKYRLDDEVMHGKYGGATLNPARTQAMLDLCFLASSAPPARVTVPLIEIILFGAVQPHPRDNGRVMGSDMIDVPSTHELMQSSLKEIKLLSAAIREQSGKTTAETAVHPLGGHAIILDYMGTAASAEAARELERIGLTTKTLFAMNQLKSSCGYLAGGWVCALRQLGAEFDTLTHENASMFNTAEWITQSNMHLSKVPSTGEDTAEWLTGDEVQELVTAVNPDAPGASPGWLSGPGPLNYWRTMLNRTVTNVASHGPVHIMVVNTDNAYSLTEEHSGSHWFVIAWSLNPATGSEEPHTASNK